MLFMEKRWKLSIKKKTITDKINSFFGYNCISNITLKIIQEKIEEKKIFPKIKDIDKITKKIQKVDNSQLKNSLNKFLKAYNERNK